MIGITGIEFIEFASKDLHSIADCFKKLGFICVGKHKRKEVFLYRQHHINFILNAEKPSDAQRFVNAHGPAINAVCFRVGDINQAIDSARDMGLELIEAEVGPMELNVPAIRGIGDSLIYFVDTYGDHSIYPIDFLLSTPMETTIEGPLHRIDHITQNVRPGNLDKTVSFYENAFGFQVLQEFDIHGERTALTSKALMSPCGTFRIAINEAEEAESQVNEFIRRFQGEGVQHVALETTNIYQTIDVLRGNGVDFQSTPASYYEGLTHRGIEHHEDLRELQSRDILIDGSLDDGILLQIFTEEIIGPLFFEVIQRKGNKGFGEGNFQALFKSIERDQARRTGFNATR